ncbi:hypothetical protein AAC387_Pa05g3602 [Persea americana]
MDIEDRWREAIMGALSSLSSRQFSLLIHSLASDSLLKHQRLFYLLTSPLHFSQTLQYIESLSLHQKTMLLARLLLRSLHKITQFFEKSKTSSGVGIAGLRDLDAGLLLLALCEVSDTNHRNWHQGITDHVLTNLLSLYGLGASGWAVLGPYVDMAIKCRRFVIAVTGQCNGVAEKAAASAMAVVSLPLVECGGVGKECVICKEGLEGGKGVCELPCGHVFHWLCVLPWLRKANTCPYCRFELPTDDVFCEIERVWRVVIERSRWGLCGDYCC